MQAAASRANVEKMAGYGRRAARLWLDFAAEGEPPGFLAPREQALPQYDKAMYGFVRKDPDNEVRLALAVLCLLVPALLRLACAWRELKGLTGAACRWQKVVALLGQDAVEEMVRLQSRDPAILMPAA